jgi:transcriptional regulator of aromatic amino acid metabolism
MAQTRKITIGYIDGLKTFEVPFLNQGATRPIMNDFEKEEAFLMFKQGFSKRKIAQYFERSDTTISNILKRFKHAK